MTKKDEERFNDVYAIDVIKAVLESGNSVELTSTGYSMFPTLRPGDRVIVKPLTKGEIPQNGSVVVYIGKGATAQRRNGVTEQGHNGGLVMHRLVEIIDGDSGKPLFITRGDSRIEPDKPWPQQHLMGVAVSYKGAKKEHSIKTFVPGAWRYLFNRRLLWLFSKIKILDGGSDLFSKK